MLLVTSTEEDARRVGRCLAEATTEVFDVWRVDRLAAALQHVCTTPTDVILLDLDLADSRGVDTFGAIYARASGTPIIVFTEPADATVAGTEELWIAALGPDGTTAGLDFSGDKALADSMLVVFAGASSAAARDAQRAA